MHIALSSNVFTQTLQFELVELDPDDPQTPATPSADVVGALFELEAYEAAAQKPLSWGDNIAPSVITIDYDASLTDENLQVLRWDASAGGRGVTSGAWVNASCNGVDVIQLKDANRFIVPVCATGNFVVVDNNSVPASVAMVAGSTLSVVSSLLITTLMVLLLSATALFVTRFRPNN